MMLRDYQLELKAKIVKAIRDGYRSIMVWSATGSGKTMTAADLMAWGERNDRSSLFLFPRRELAKQTQKTLRRFGVEAGIIMAGEPMDSTRRVQLASFDTLHHRAVLRNKVAMPPANLLITDEAHLSSAETRFNIIKSYEGAIHIGFSASPAAKNGRPLRKLYDTLVLGPPVRQLIDEGYLVEPRYFAPSGPDVSAMKVRGGDYTEESAEKEMMKPKLIGDVYQNWARIAPNDSTVVFCVTRAHARAVCAEFVKHGVKAEYVDGETPKIERRDIFARVESRETQVLVNVFVASYGLDIPILQTAVLARPTKSLVLYVQMGGRVLRPVYADGFDLDDLAGRLMAIQFSGKTDAKIIDHSGAVERLGYLDEPFPWTLDGDDDIAEVMQKQREERNEPKLLTCPRCKTVFKGSRCCPHCGFEFIPPGVPVPTHKADLQEIIREGKAANRNTPWDEKAAFFAQALGYAQQKGKRLGFAAHLYHDKFGVWPNHPNVKYQAPKPPGEMIINFIKHRAIKRAKANV
jgi:DNA repair protein RadD